MSGASNARWPGREKCFRGVAVVWLASMTVDCSSDSSTVRTTTDPTPQPAAASFTLAVEPGSSGSGTIVGSVNGSTYRCVVLNGTPSGNCSGRATVGTTLTVTVSIDAASQFTGWTGACTSTGASCSVRLTNSTTTVTARLVAMTRLTIRPDATSSGTGSVTWPDGAACAVTELSFSGTCDRTVPTGGATTLRVVEGSSTRFKGWSGDCAATSGASCSTSTRASSSNVEVRFVRLFALKMLGVALDASGPPGSGTVSGAEMNCAYSGPWPVASLAGVCSTVVENGQRVTLVAAPAFGSVFVRWGTRYWYQSTNASCSMTVDQDFQVSPSFVSRADVQGHRLVGSDEVVAVPRMTAGDTASFVVWTFNQPRLRVVIKGGSGNLTMNVGSLPAGSPEFCALVGPIDAGNPRFNSWYNFVARIRYLDCALRRANDRGQRHQQSVFSGTLD